MERLRREIYYYIKNNTLMEDIEMGFFGDVAIELQQEFNISLEEAEHYIDDFLKDVVNFEELNNTEE
jgi:hypothetical protein